MNNFPRPVIVDYTAFLYEGFNRRELLVQHCNRCGKLRHPPNPFCPVCHCDEWTAKPVSGKGRIHSYTIQRHPPVPPYPSPHPIVLADMHEGFRFLAAADEISPEAITIGMRVQLGFVAVEPDYVLPVFRACATLS